MSNQHYEVVRFALLKYSGVDFNAGISGAVGQRVPIIEPNGSIAANSIKCASISLDSEFGTLVITWR